MADIITNQKTSLPCEEVVIRAVQFFSTENWQVTSQSGRAVTLKGKMPIPIGMILLMILGYMACFVPGIILYFMVIKKMRGFQNLVVTASPIERGSEVSVSHPKHAKKTVAKFTAALPPFS